METEGTHDGMATSEIEDAAARLLGAFYDLSGGALVYPVPLRDPEHPDRGAASAADMFPHSTLPDVSVRYLLNKGYIEEETPPNARAGADPVYVLTVAGVDEVRRTRGLDPPPQGGRMSEKTQRRLLTVLAIVLSVVLARPFTRLINEEIPERRGFRDDLAEAVLKGTARMAAFFIASVIVRRLASR